MTSPFTTATMRVWSVAGVAAGLVGAGAASAAGPGAASMAASATAAMRHARWVRVRDNSHGRSSRSYRAR